MRADFEIAAMILETRPSNYAKGGYIVVRPEDHDKLARHDSPDSWLHKVCCYLTAVEVQKYFWLRKKCQASVVQKLDDKTLWVWVTPSNKVWRGKP
jgi:hypothetical protein